MDMDMDTDTYTDTDTDADTRTDTDTGRQPFRYIYTEVMHTPRTTRLHNTSVATHSTFTHTQSNMVRPVSWANASKEEIADAISNFPFVRLFQVRLSWLGCLLF